VRHHTLRLFIPSDYLNCQATGGAHLEVEAKDPAPLYPPGRVPHVCAGVAGALHGLNEMGRSPFRCSHSRAAKPKTKRCEADLSRHAPARRGARRGWICSSADSSWKCFRHSQLHRARSSPGQKRRLQHRAKNRPALARNGTFTISFNAERLHGFDRCGAASRHHSGQKHRDQQQERSRAITHRVERRNPEEHATQQTHRCNGP
jgi:hypothetical protein